MKQPFNLAILAMSCVYACPTSQANENLSVSLGTNNTLTTVAAYYQDFSSQSESSNGSSSTNSKKANSLDPGYSLRLDVRLQPWKSQSFSATPIFSIEQSQAIMHWPNGMGIFIDPVTLYSYNYSFMLGIENKWHISERHTLALTAAHKNLSIKDNIHMGSWRLEEAAVVTGNYVSIEYQYKLLQKSKYNIYLYGNVNQYKKMPRHQLG